MKNVLTTFLVVFITLTAGILIGRYVLSNTSELEREIDRMKQRNDSLNTVIRQWQDSLRQSQEKIARYEEQITRLDQQIRQKQKEINYYKRKGRFEYEFSTDSLHRELNRIIKQRLQSVTGPNRLP